MKAIFFGHVERQLFGAYHAASDEGPVREAAVVLCYPWLAEYNMTHWAFRNLATLLARAGFGVLRFDYGGMGDSMGTTASADINAWAGDIATAAREVRELSGARELCLVGKGLGATLAALATADVPTRDLVCWDPVVSGAEYLAELERVDAQQRLSRLCPPAPPGPREELLGFAVPRAQRTALAQLDLLRTAPRITGAITLVANQTRLAYGRAVETLTRAGSRATMEFVEENVGAQVSDGQTALLSSASLTAIVAALVRGERP